MAAWTIDPGQVHDGSVSDDVCDKALRVFEARVIVHLGQVHLRNGDQVDGFKVPSWTKRWRTYVVNLTTHPDGTREADCVCDAKGWCHHGYAAVFELDRLAGHLTLVPGGQP